MAKLTKAENIAWSNNWDKWLEAGRQLAKARVARAQAERSEAKQAQRSVARVEDRASTNQF